MPFYLKRGAYLFLSLHSYCDIYRSEIPDYGQLRVLFYATFEKGNIKKTEIQPYTLDRIISRGSEGLYQIENTPEVALLHGEDVLEDSVFGVCFQYIRGP